MVYSYCHLRRFGGGIFKGFDKDIELAERVLIWATVGYGIISILMYFLLYMPIITSLKNTNTKIWKLSRLIRGF
jgi:hypothetical protein